MPATTYALFGKRGKSPFQDKRVDMFAMNTAILPLMLMVEAWPWLLFAPIGAWLMMWGLVASEWL